MMELKKDPFNVVIAGVGGQGNVLASLILGRYFVGQGYKVTIGETYGVSQRGGSVMSHLRISRKMQFAPIIPKGDANLVIGLEPVEALRILHNFGNWDIEIIVNIRPVYPMAVLSGECAYPPLRNITDALHLYSRRLWTINATEIALELGNSILANIVMLGAVLATQVIDIQEDMFKEVLKESLPEKSVEKNILAFHKGMEKLIEK
jgi:indolepyruvate ferredoxin oxidoreductase beta subunit